MPIKSIDPRITRANIEIQNKETSKENKVLEKLDHWQTYEVFAQNKRGEHYSHVGSLHAPNPEMAWILAKEQFGRRNKITGIWITKTSDIFSVTENEEEMFELNSEKIYREAGGYKVMERINKFKKENKKISEK